MLSAFFSVISGTKNKLFLFSLIKSFLIVSESKEILELSSNMEKLRLSISLVNIFIICNCFFNILHDEIYV